MDLNPWNDEEYNTDYKLSRFEATTLLTRDERG